MAMKIKVREAAKKSKTYSVETCKKSGAGVFNEKTKKAFKLEAPSPKELLDKILAELGWDPEEELDGWDIETFDDVSDYLEGCEESGGTMVISLEGPGISYSSANYDG